MKVSIKKQKKKENLKVKQKENFKLYPIEYTKKLMIKKHINVMEAIDILDIPDDISQAVIDEIEKKN